MCEAETELEAVAVVPCLYRQLWLDTANDLGMVAEALAEATGWQPSEDAPLPDALELAGVAASRIAELERLLGGVGHRGQQNRRSRSHRAGTAMGAVEAAVLSLN